MRLVVASSAEEGRAPLEAIGLPPAGEDLLAAGGPRDAVLGEGGGAY